MRHPVLYLKKNHDRRVRLGHPWIYSNEINTVLSPIKSFTPGDEVIVYNHTKQFVGMATINPQSLITARIYSHEQNETLTTEVFKNKIHQAYLLREAFFDKPYYRLVFAESDGLPGLIIDRFGDHFAIQTNTVGMEIRQPLIAEALQILFPNIQSILLKNTSSVRQQEGLEVYTKALLGEPPTDISLIENDISFIAPFLEGQKTSWFYDHRDNRMLIARSLKNKAVLDVFSYLGAFGITAAKCGAKTVDCVESSKLACQYIAKNAKLNQQDSNVHVIEADAFDALKALLLDKKTYDVILIDPPAFIKRAKDRAAGFLAYQRINELALKLLKPMGFLVSCSCSMHLSETDLLEAVNRAAFHARLSVQLIAKGHQGIDHPIHPQIPETNYLKALVFRKV